MLWATQLKIVLMLWATQFHLIIRFAPRLPPYRRSKISLRTIVSIAHLLISCFHVPEHTAHQVPETVDKPSPHGMVTALSLMS